MTILIIPSKPSPNFPDNGNQSSHVSPFRTFAGIPICAHAINSSTVNEHSSKISKHMFETPCGSKLKKNDYVISNNQLPLNIPIPFRSLAPIVISIGLVDTMSHPNTDIRIHTRHPIIFIQLGLHYSQSQTPRRVMRIRHADQLLLQSHRCLRVKGFLSLLVI